jgi:hypothetical protein
MSMYAGNEGRRDVERERLRDREGKRTRKSLFLHVWLTNRQTNSIPGTSEGRGIAEKNLECEVEHA